MKEPSQSQESNQFLKTDGGKSKSNAIQVPSIALPKGGGAIKGIDEKFSVNAVNGTSSFSIPLPFSPARGVVPSLNLSYSSGAGNGIFGLGWNINLGSIKRKTDKGLPQYSDTINSDTFLFSEAEDLVPEFKKNPDKSFLMNNGEYVFHEMDSPDKQYIIRRYIPRIEGLFARIERWTNKSNGRIKWRFISKDNLTTLYGWTDNSIIANPNDPTKIYEWLPEFIFDDKGNCSQYIYKKEDQIGFDNTLLHGRNRLKNGLITYTNTYLEKILYGNLSPYKKFEDPFPTETDYLFQTIFDYGILSDNDTPEKINAWTFREDAFSNYKAGFEIRTTRLCRRVLLFHVFTELALKTDKSDKKTLIKSLNFEYDTSAEQDFTFLKKITSYGYIKKNDSSYSCKNMPPMEFEYQKHDWSLEVKTISSSDLIHAPTGIDEHHYQFTDLFNEGLSGILTEQGNGWFYKQNMGNGQFEQAKPVSPKPSFAGLGGSLQLADLDADGSRQLVSYGIEPKGYFELTDDNEWLGFRSFQNLPNIDFSDANTRMIDLNGDGKPEVIISEDEVFTWYASEGRTGFSAAQKVLKSFDEEDGPHMVFADTTQSIYLADMSGDGLTDIVRIRNGEVCYWPNLGYGHFGSKVLTDNSPIFDFSDNFNPSNVRLADIDGSGTTDIIYLGKNKFTCWKNLSGNRFSVTPFEINSIPEIHNQSKLTVTDLLGNGIACIVWSSNLSKDADSPLKYIDLMNSKKPHLMVAYKNNLGKEVALEYTPSTKFYIEDKLAGKPWITKLHFPVHCISKSTVTDKISGNKYTSQYKYHHGYYDHTEREFRGFGMVEQINSETFEHWVKSGATNITDACLHQEPVVSKSWQHTGAFFRREQLLDQFAQDYWYEEMLRQGFPVTHHEIPLSDAKLITSSGIKLPANYNLSATEWEEALRACKGMALRSETFAKDAAKYGNTPAANLKELTPYSVTSSNCIIELIQPKGQNLHAVFIVKERETITYNYEREIADPRITHQLNIELDEYGNVLESATVVYPRKTTDTSLPQDTQKEQSKTTIIYSQNQFTNDAEGDHVHRLRLASEIKTYELKGVSKSNPYYLPSDFENILSDSRSDTAFYHEINKTPANNKPLKRLIEHLRTIYYRDDLTNSLPLHQMESLALTYENYQLAYTPELVTDIFGNKADASVLTEGKFTNSENDNNWWIRSGISQYKTTTENILNVQNRFYLPIAYTDPFGATTKVKYYNTYHLLISETEDALGNRAGVASFNFRTLAPKKMKDINGNFTETISDELGLVKAIALMGKGMEADDLTNIMEITDLGEEALINQFFQAADSVQLTSTAKQLLNHATSRFIYNFDSYLTSGQPVVTASIAREQHYRQLADSAVQIAFEYSGGSGEVVMKKTQAEPGVAKQIIINPNNTYSLTTPDPDTSKLKPQQLRWTGNGKIIKNNKGNAVKQYQPYFSLSWKYESFKELVETGVTSVMYYDAAGRLIKTEMPDGTYSKVEFNAWKQTLFDSNDTVLDSTWYKNRTLHLIDAELIAEGKDPAKEKLAAEKSAKHAATPNTFHFDTLGRPILSIDHNKNSTTLLDEFFNTSINMDAEGNLRTVIDARGNLVMEYKYDMLGNLVYQSSMDSGKRWLLHNIMSKPLRTWDERNHEFQYFYDIVQRPTHSKVINGDGAMPMNHLFERLVYGESLLDDIRTDADRQNETNLQNRNILGQVIQHYDTGGLINTPDYDFKGQPLSTTRQLFIRYKDVANWIDQNLVNDLEPGSGFTFINHSDALGRITEQTAPDGSVIKPSYNEAGLLNGEIVLHAGAVTPSVYIKDIDYNEKGQREKIIYGNDISTRFYYDKETFRLRRVESKRKNGEVLQNLYYTFDAIGNMTHIEDKAVPISFFSNTIIEPVSEYTYDALYRLTEATGRENNSALNFGTCDNWQDKPFMTSMDPGNPMAIRDYTQRYSYDEVGNIKEMKHLANGGNWTRGYEYETSSNRLKRTFIGDNGNPINYTNYQHHSLHGYLEELPHLEKISWNFKEEVILTSRQKCTGDNIPVITYYQYDGSGQRIRKITENQTSGTGIATKKEERIYLAGYELFIRYDGTTPLKRESLSLMDKGHRFVMVETRNDVDDGTEKQLVRYQLHNHLGSAVIELDDKAQIISYEEFHPYGTTAYQAKNSKIKSAAKRYRYTGMERDEETGLEYHSARYYLPWLGRWLSADPIFMSNQSSLYSYSSSNPITHKDVNGQYDPSAFGKSLEAKISNAEESLLLEDKNIGTSLVNTAIATTSTVAKGFLSILQVGTGAAQGVEDIKRGFSEKGDAWDVAIGTSRILSDAGEVASTALGVAGNATKVARMGKAIKIEKEINSLRTKAATLERRIDELGPASNSSTKSIPQKMRQSLQKDVNDIKEKIGELASDKAATSAGLTDMGNPRRLAKGGKNPGAPVSQGLDKVYTGKKPFAKDRAVVVEAKANLSNNANATKGVPLKTDTNGLTQGSADYIADRLQSAVTGGLTPNPVAQTLQQGLGTGALKLESFAVVGDTALGGSSKVFSISGQSGVPSLRSAMGFGSEVTTMNLTYAADQTFRGWH